MSDPIAEAYTRIRDAAMVEGCPRGQLVAILELVKAEIVRDMQADIDAGV